MERLTKVMTCPDGTRLYDISNKLFKADASRAEKTSMILKKLAAYEDAEEQGRIMPCKVGNQIYAITCDNEQEKYMVTKSEIIEVTQNCNGWFF